MWFLSREHVFSEISWSQNQTLSNLSGLVLTLDPKLSFSLLSRIYSPSYQSIASNAFGESSVNRNENGVYIGLSYKLLKKIIINAYFDQYRFPWIKNYLPSPTTGKDLLIKLDYARSKRVMTSIKYRIRENQIRSLNHLIIQKSIQLRLDNKIIVSPEIELKLRLEWKHIKDSKNKNGFLFYTDFNWSSVDKPYSFSLRYSLFNTDDYSTRIYAYERDVYYAYSIKAYFGQGQKIYLNFKWKGNPVEKSWPDMAENSG